MVDVKLSQIAIGTTNPRKRFGGVEFVDLVESIRKYGILHPVIVHKRKGLENRFELVCGERRLRAAQELKFDVIPAEVRENLSTAEVIELQLIENIQRQDLTPVEEGRAFKALMVASKCTQEDVGKKIGKSQGYVAARMSLLDLREDFLKLLEEGKLLPGHVKFMLIMKGCDTLLDKLSKNLKEYWKTSDIINVRDFEELVKNTLSRSAKPLYQSQYGGGPEFDMKPCEKCQFNIKANISWNGEKKYCFKPDCWGTKQKTVHKAEAERIRQKVADGKMVKENELPKDVQTFDYCRFDKKSCAKCDKRKAAMVKQNYGNGKEKKEICLDKACFAKKQKDAEEAKEKVEQEAFKKQVEKCKQAAVKGKIDREFIITLIAEKLEYADHEELTLAYGIKKDLIQNKKKLKEYFTRNIKVNVEEILRFVTYWND